MMIFPRQTFDYHHIRSGHLTDMGKLTALFSPVIFVVYCTFGVIEDSVQHIFTYKHAQLFPNSV